METRCLFLSLFSRFFSVCSSSPMSASIAEIEMGFRPLWLHHFFLPSFHSLLLSFFSPFLALVRADSVVVGVGSPIINKYYYYWRVTPVGSIQRYYISLGGQEKKKDRKTRKGRSEEKVVGFSSASLFPTRKWESVTQGGTRGIDHLMRRRIRGAGIVKGWEDKWDRVCIPDTFT